MNDRDQANEETLGAILTALHKHPEIRILRRIPFMPAFRAEGDQAEWKRAVILDSETTGLDTKTAKVTELGLAEVWYHDVGGLKAFGRCLSWLEDPGEPLSEEVKRVTKLTDEQLAGQKIPDQEVADFIGDAGIVIAHNAAFDRPIVERRFGDWSTSKAWACSKTEVPWKEYGSPATNQIVIAWSAGLFYDAHRAADDCAALAYLLTCIRLGHRYPLGDLIESARQPLYRVVATNSDFSVKDALKARGYLFNGGRKQWWIKKNSQDEANAEGAWLRDNILRGRDPDYELISARDRYSIRAE